MNKTIKILLAIIGAIDVVFNLVAPILICTLWVNLFDMDGLMAILFYGIGFISSVFRGIKMVVFK